MIQLAKKRSYRSEIEGGGPLGGQVLSPSQFYFGIQQTFIEYNIPFPSQSDEILEF